MIGITGATGSIGSELSLLLAQSHIGARVMCRREAQLERFNALGHEAVLANFDHPETLDAAIKGCEKLFLLTAPDEAHFEREKRIIDIAVNAGVGHIVRISTSDANLGASLAYARSHAQIDHYLRAQPVAWTILRPTGFMQNFVESAYAISKGSLPHMLADGQISYIDLRDIALVAKHILTEEGHHRAMYFLTGPESLTVDQVAALLSNNLGIQVKEQRVSEAEMREMLRYSGMSAWYQDALIAQFRIGASGGEIDVTEEIQRITGSAPRNLATFAADYKNQLLNPKH